jgi:hypothetical protein
MSKGTKSDSEKPQINLIPREALEGMAKAFMYGAGKYGRFNFKNGLEYTRLTDATMRHIIQFLDGEDIDVESGNSHISHALASLAMLAYMIENKPDFDNRWKAE